MTRGAVRCGPRRAMRGFRHEIDPIPRATGVPGLAPHEGHSTRLAKSVPCKGRTRRDTDTPRPSKFVRIRLQLRVGVLVDPGELGQGDDGLPLLSEILLAFGAPFY